MAFSGVTNPETIELIERYGLHQISRETLLQQVWAIVQDFLAG